MLLLLLFIYLRDKIYKWTIVRHLKKKKEFWSIICSNQPRNQLTIPSNQPKKPAYCLQVRLTGNQTISSNQLRKPNNNSWNHQPQMINIWFIIDSLPIFCHHFQLRSHQTDRAKYAPLTNHIGHLTSSAPLLQLPYADSLQGTPEAFCSFHYKAKYYALNTYYFYILN